MKRRLSSVTSESPEYNSDSSAEDDEIDVVSPHTETPKAKRIKQEQTLAAESSVEIKPSGGNFAGPSLEIVEQPRQRGFRFRYPCEGPCHGELRGEHSEPRRKTYPTVRLRDFTGRARVVVSLVCHDEPVRPHAHCLVGRNVVSGQCTVEIGPETKWTASFPRLSILHIPKKNAARVLLERYALARVCSVPPHRGSVAGADRDSFGDVKSEGDNVSNDRMALELQLQPGSREQLAGGAAALASLPDEERRALEQMAAEQARGMNLNVVRLCFQAFLPDEQGRFTQAMPSCISQAIYDTKAASSSALRIYRLDRHSGSVMGGDEIFMLCDRVQKDDIVVRFYEDRSSRESDGVSGMTAQDYWEADGVFSPNDVHRQSAIVFKTPPYRNTAITRPTKVWVALKRRSEEEMGEAHQFTYLPPNTCQCSCHKKEGSPKQTTMPSSLPLSPQASQLAQTAMSARHIPETADIPTQVAPMMAPGGPNHAGLYYFGLYNTALAPMAPVAPMLPFYGPPATALMPTPGARLAMTPNGESVVQSVK